MIEQRHLMITSRITEEENSKSPLWRSVFALVGQLTFTSFS